LYVQPGAGNPYIAIEAECIADALSMLNIDSLVLVMYSWSR